MCNFFLKLGYEIVKGQGKGSHIKLRKKNNPTITVPNHKELSKGLEASLLKDLEAAKKRCEYEV